MVALASEKAGPPVDLFDGAVLAATHRLPSQDPQPAPIAVRQINGRVPLPEEVPVIVAAYLDLRQGYEEVLAGRLA